VQNVSLQPLCKIFQLKNTYNQILLIILATLNNNNMSTERKTKAVAGYQMLMILSAVDGIFNAKEDKIIQQYLIENFSHKANLDNEMEVLAALPQDEYAIHFNNAMNDFYLDSTAEERNHFLDFAVKLAIADKKITPKENLFLNELFNAWEANYSF